MPSPLSNPFLCLDYGDALALEMISLSALFLPFFLTFEVTKKFLWKKGKDLNRVEVIVRSKFVEDDLNRTGLWAWKTCQKDISRIKSLGKIASDVERHFRKLNEYLALYFSNSFPDYSILRLSYLGRRFSLEKISHNEFMAAALALRDYILIEPSRINRVENVRNYLPTLRSCIGQGECRPSDSAYLWNLPDYLSEGAEVTLQKVYQLYLRRPLPDTNSVDLHPADYSREDT